MKKDNVSDLDTDPRFTRRSYRRVKVSSIVLAPIEPDARLSQTALKSLSVDIAVRGILQPLAVVRYENGYMLADGHRRDQCARDLGIQDVDVMIFEDATSENIPELFALLNRNTRRMSGPEWLDYWLKTGGHLDGLSVLPKPTASQIRRCLKIFGSKQTLRRMVERKIGPHISNTIDAVALSFGDKDSIKNKPSQREIGEWAIEHNTTEVLDHLKSIGKAGIKVDVLRKLARRINNDKPITVAELYA